MRRMTPRILLMSDLFSFNDHGDRPDVKPKHAVWLRLERATIQPRLVAEIPLHRAHNDPPVAWDQSSIETTTPSAPLESNLERDAESQPENQSSPPPQS